VDESIDGERVEGSQFFDNLSGRNSGENNNLRTVYMRRGIKCGSEASLRKKKI
jgi:hypothetical protein